MKLYDYFFAAVIGRTTLNFQATLQHEIDSIEAVRDAARPVFEALQRSNPELIGNRKALVVTNFQLMGIRILDESGKNPAS